MFVVFKNKETFDTVQYNNVTNIAFNGTNYTITLSDSTTATYSASNWHIWQFN